MQIVLDITEDQAHTIMAATAFLSDDDPLKLIILTAIAFARRMDSLAMEAMTESAPLVPGRYILTRED